MSRKIHTRLGVLILAAAAMGAMAAPARGNEETGKLKIHVSPKQAYVFVDGKAIREGSQTIELAAGTHQVGVDNYGYVAKTQPVKIGAGETTDLNVVLQASGDRVSGPFGDIEFKGDPRAAVLLNGKTPDYFVGHVDEFDWNWIWHQRLLVQPGTYAVTVTRRGNTIWSGPVTVKAGEQVTVHLDNGRLDTKNWPEGNTMGPQPRFHAGIASATVPVAPVTAQFSAQSSQLACGQPAELSWKSENAASVSISDLGDVARDGDRTVRPTKTTTYALVAKGPGGEVTKTETVDVNGAPSVTLALSAPEAVYHKVGDKVEQDGSSTLSWSTQNASKVVIAPLGSEPATGSATVQAEPANDSPGPINETQGYTIRASDECGQTTTKTVMLHVTGSIDPPPSLTLASVFYPTDYPTPKHARIGLLRSEENTLTNAAQRFENYRSFNGKADLLVVGHADVRGPDRYNMELGQRRAELVKAFLVSKGVDPSEIQTKSNGKQEQLAEKQVSALQAKDTQKPESRLEHSAKTTWLAYNRRVDIVLEPQGEQSVVEYPNAAPDAQLLLDRSEPGLKKVEAAQQAINGQASLHAALTQD